MASKLVTRGDAREEVRFRFSKGSATALKELKERIKERGYTTTIDEEIERLVSRVVDRATKDLDELESEGQQRVEPAL